MPGIEALRATLARIDGRGYRAYQDIAGVYRAGNIEVAIDHVQGDPFASPSRVRLIMPTSALRLPAHPERVRRIALEDFLARRARAAIPRTVPPPRGTGKSGQVTIDAGRQVILERTACRITPDTVELRLSVGLPAQGRSIMGDAAIDLLVVSLPRLAHAALRLEDLGEAEAFIAVAEDAEALRATLADHGLVAFVADGAILPRKSGVLQEPLRGRVVPFATPPELGVELTAPHAGRVRGMGIPEGVTLIVGGGFHGKSTLLDALVRGVYNHIPGDGRERVVTRADGVKIRAEDGRSVAGVDLSPFIRNLPLDSSTRAFTSENASGSTSQAANIMEALEVGARLLLMDEDTCATNFMVRDRLMRELVPSSAEPITPLIDRVRQLHREAGVSSILVMGGVGDYFSVADTVIWMRAYEPSVVTERAHQLAVASGQPRPEPPDPWPGVRARVVRPDSIDPRRRGRTRVRARGIDELGFGYEEVDLGEVEQIVDPSQTRAIGAAILTALNLGYIDGRRDLDGIVQRIERLIDDRGLDALSSDRGHPGDLARPRRFELAAAINRLRTLQVQQEGGG